MSEYPVIKDSDRPLLGSRSHHRCLEDQGQSLYNKISQEQGLVYICADPSHTQGAVMVFSHRPFRAGGDHDTGLMGMIGYAAIQRCPHARAFFESIEQNPPRE